jgi:hypothetical protein
MSESGLSLDMWMDAAEGSASDIAQQALSMDGCTVTDRGARLPTGLCGSYIPLVGDEDSIHIGLVASEAGCQTLARALLCMTEDEKLPPADVADALGEILNMMAGNLKRRVNEKIPSLALGLPIFINGSIEPTEKLSSMVAFVKIGKVDAALLVLSHGNLPKR